MHEALSLESSGQGCVDESVGADFRDSQQLPRSGRKPEVYRCKHLAGFNSV